MDVHDSAKIFGRHFCKGPIAQDPGIVDQDVDAAEARHGALNQALGASLV